VRTASLPKLITSTARRNSFTTEFFIPADKFIKMLETDGSIHVRLDPPTLRHQQFGCVVDLTLA
jgi:hypothetical protein